MGDHRLVVGYLLLKGDVFYVFGIGWNALNQPIMLIIISLICRPRSRVKTVVEEKYQASLKNVVQRITYAQENVVFYILLIHKVYKTTHVNQYSYIGLQNNT